MSPTITTPVGSLSAAQVASVIRAATLAPSQHNTQPWQFSCTPHSIELYADRHRSLPVADPNHRELLLSCGAALMNLRLAITACGVRPITNLRAGDDPIATVRPSDTVRENADTKNDQWLVEAIPFRRTVRRPFSPLPVGREVIKQLRRAAEIEHAWLPILDSAQRTALHELVLRAHRRQRDDPAFQAEWAWWNDRAGDQRHELPAFGEATLPEHSLKASPLTVMIGTLGDSPLDWLRAGQAMQRVLLAAAAAGLCASFVSQPIEVDSTRAELRSLVGDGLWPQILLRIGYADLAKPAPRRPIEEVLIKSRSAPPSRGTERGESGRTR
ncbi:MAG: hypothetical protein GEU98_01590 [Pseudonocardiaceae bacterium]|nr:hypothetical protein [Pseudonocardiaceae bacterium]